MGVPARAIDSRQVLAQFQPRERNMDRERWESSQVPANIVSLAAETAAQRLVELGWRGSAMGPCRLAAFIFSIAQSKTQSRYV